MVAGGRGHAVLAALRGDGQPGDGRPERVGVACGHLACRAAWDSSPRRLLAGQATAEGGRMRAALAVRMLELTVVIVALGPSLALLLTPLNEAIRGRALFRRRRAMALAALLALVGCVCGPDGPGRAVTAGGGNLARLALRNAARNPGRSTLTIGLVAAATFLIVAVSAFRLDPRGQTPALHSGNGGYRPGGRKRSAAHWPI